MGTALVSLVTFFLVIGTTMTAVNTVLKTGSDNAQTLAISNEQLISELETSIKIISVSTSNNSGVSYVDVVITNDGRRTIEDYDDWDVSVRYDRTGVSGEITVIAPYVSPISDNTWTVLSHWLDYGNSVAELIEPGHINQHEEIVMRIQLNPEIQTSTTGLVTIATSTGLTGSILFES